MLQGSGVGVNPWASQQIPTSQTDSDLLYLWNTVFLVMYYNFFFYYEK